MDMCDRAIEIDPNDSFSYNSKGLVLTALAQHKEAIDEYDKVLEIDSKTHYYKGISLVILQHISVRVHPLL